MAFQATPTAFQAVALRSATKERDAWSVAFQATPTAFQAVALRCGSESPTVNYAWEELAFPAAI